MDGERQLKVIKMIELTQIEIEIGYGDDCELVEITRGEVLELITSLREAEMDAARYRWLCEQAWFQVESEWQLILGETETEDDFIICANEKIDQAMKEKGDE